MESPRVYREVWRDPEVEVWWRQGRTTPLVIAGEHDWSGMYGGDVVTLCWACAVGQAHSIRAHWTALFLRRSEAFDLASTWE